MTRVLLIRHGETDWNRQGRYQGHADVPLNATGQEQARKVALDLRNTIVDAIYSSDLKRSYATANIIAMECGKDVEVDRRLREIDQGEWEGMLFSDIRIQYPDVLERRLQKPWAVAPPGGESLEDVRERVLAVMCEITDRHPCGAVVVVSHGLSIALVLAQADGIESRKVWELIPNNAVVSVVEVEREDLEKAVKWD